MRGTKSSQFGRKRYTSTIFPLDACEPRGGIDRFAFPPPSEQLVHGIEFLLGFTIGKSGNVGLRPFFSDHAWRRRTWEDSDVL
jgi:hypothetical protein